MDPQEKTVELMIFLLEEMQTADRHIGRLERDNQHRLEETGKMIDETREHLAWLRAVK